MGISGLLPLLKDIQTSKHLSEFRGKTLAVDGYVWLHRGCYGCATELATGKRTTKYVEYAMHRVRLLRHHGIEPYLVFDGGPLPAKQGTESERKQRREENLSRANALAAQGKHSQAREYYVKCVDVTPQMAYQLIKVLRAEGVQYVVAPYEADAQLAYLERIGLVDGIITEDSDLLVFGCKTVLYKLDTTASTVTCISREDFASVASTTAGGLSLVGWTDTQFRAMAILSGCDYLPSIPGIGLKTAWNLLRKHKTVENMLMVLRLEGKKKIPEGYLDAFRLAEKVFLYQRVYDPMQERLVHLTPLPDGEPWDAEKEAYVGAHIEPSLAKQVAQGEACPITLLPMEDINPSFVPRALKPIPMNAFTPAGHRPDKGKGKAKDPAPTPGKLSPAGPLLKFFSPQVRETAGASDSGVHASQLGSAASERARMSPRPPNAGKPAMVVGNKSGKRTLAEVMQEEMAAKRKKHDEDWAAAAAGGAPAAPVLSGAVPVRTPTTSKFFLAQQRSVSDPRGARAWVHAGGAAASTPTAASRPSSASAISLLASPGAGPSRLSLRGRQSEELHREQEKENLPCDGPNAHADAETGDGEAEADKPMGEPDAVEQEEGYLSPAPSLAQWDSPDISSPVRPRTGRSPAGGDGWDDEFDADVLSSPPLHRQGRRPPSRSGSFTGERVVTRALPLVRLRAPRFGGSAGRRASTSKSISGHREDEREEPGRGPDLRDVFDDWDEVTSGDEDSEWLAEREDGVGSTASSTPGPVTPAEDVGDEDVKMLPSAADEGSSEELEDEDDMRPAETVADCDELEEAAARNASVKVAHGWWAKWARSGTSAGAVAQGEGGGPKAPSSARGSSDRQRAPLRRRETTITPDGRQRPLTASRATAAGFWRGPQSAPQVSKRKSLQEDDLRATGRTRLTFTTEDVGTTPKAGGAKAAGFLRPGSVSGSKEAEGQEEAEDVSRTTVSSRNRHRLEQFRWTPACR